MKVNIIGAGISGLSAGCYLQMNGFETEIFERNSRSGGLCTSWSKNGYTFDGCIHWLLGSNSSNAFYKLWSELIDMEAVEFISHEINCEIQVKRTSDKYGNPVFYLYSDLDRFRDYLTDIAPEDSRIIQRLIKSMRKIQKYEVPPLVDTMPKYLTWRQKVGMVRYIPLLAEFIRWKHVTNFTFADKLSNPFLKEAFQLLFDGLEVKMLVFTMPMAFYDKKGAGYPVGGSYRFIQRIEQRYLALGGRIRFNSDVEEIITEQNEALGLRLAGGDSIYSDLTISAADWHYTVFGALKGKFVDKEILALSSEKKLAVYSSIFMVSLGVSVSLKDKPHFFRFPLDEVLLSPDGTSYERFEVHIYNYDPTFAPEGKTIVTVSFYTSQGNFWIDLRKNDKEGYLRLKSQFSEQIINLLEKKIPGLRDQIEMIDIATPATYYRFSNNWKGSAQGWYPGRNIAARSPVKQELPGLKNFYYCSHWSVPGGGLPVALKSARDIVQTICHKHKIRFNIEKP